MSNRSLKLVQSARGVAATAVVAFHAAIYLGQRNGQGPLFDNWLHAGCLGVDFFFVLSGFIIMYAHGNDIGHPEALKSYAWKRFTRIYPTYWIVTSAALILSFAHHGAPQLSSPQWLTTLSLVRFDGFHTPLDQAWTLFFEVLFYAVFAVLIVNKRVGLVLGGVWLAAILFNFTYYTHGDFGAVQTLLSACNLNFLLGVLVAVAYRRLPAAAAFSIAAAGVATIGAFIVFEHFHGEQLQARWIYALGFAAVLLGIVKLEATREIKVSGPMKLIGDASYSIYLAHVLLIGVVLRILQVGGLVWLLPDTLLFFVCVLGALALGCAFHLYVEAPLMRAFRRGRPRARAIRALTPS
jgi:peptidoglycan/LPS O-acetylase OafA/YrhL